MPQSDPSSFHVRLSPALMKRIKVAAAENERSINAEIAARLDDSFGVTNEERQKLRTLLSEATRMLGK